MPSLRDFRRKIKSVKSTQQITQAMKMVSAARLQRAQSRILSARPFAVRMHDVLHDLASRIEGEPAAGMDNMPPHPLLEKRKSGTPAMLLITADKGLCGSFNTNLIHSAMAYLASRRSEQVRVFVAGRKGRDFFRRQGIPVAQEYVGFSGKPGFTHAELIGKDLIEAYMAHNLSEVTIIYNEFKSAISQRLVTERLLPVERRGDAPAGSGGVDYLYEPTRPELLAALLPRYVKSQVYRALLESYAAETGARMAAMDNATRSAREMILNLTLTANKIRQSGITREILEVVSGAEVLQ